MSDNAAYEELLEDNIDILQDKVEFLESLLSSFWTGDVPEDATLDHMILAKAGRGRIEERVKVCALLAGNA